LPFQFRTPQEERGAARAELQNSASEYTDHLGRPSMTPIEYLFYQPRYENETVDGATIKVVIRPGYDKLTLRKKKGHASMTHSSEKRTYGVRAVEEISPIARVKTT